MPINSTKILGCCALTASILLGQSVLAEIWTVPDDHLTIMDAVNVAADGDTILVKPGRYDESIHNSDKYIEIRGTSLDASQVEIVCDNQWHTVWNLEENPANGRTVKFANMTFRKRDPNLNSSIFVGDTTVEFSNCQFIGLSLSADNNDNTLLGGALNMYFSTVTFTLCHFENNVLDNKHDTDFAISSGGAVWADRCNLYVRQCSFVGNESRARSRADQVSDHGDAASGGAIAASICYDVEITDCYFGFNRTWCLGQRLGSAESHGGALRLTHPETAYVANNFFEGNRAEWDNAVDSIWSGCNGGAAYYKTHQHSKIVAEFNLYSENHADESGGGVYALGVQTNVFSSEFSCNTVNQVDGVAFMEFDNIYEECPDLCPADIDDNDVVEIQDLLAVLNAWGPVEAGHDADLNDDAMVDIQDLLVVIRDWGGC